MAWHDREASYSHHFRFEQLLKLHRLTEDWIDALREASTNQPSHALDRGLSHEITDQLWMLGSLDPRGLESLLDDTSPEDVLGRLERTVWSVQSYTLAKLLERTRDEESRVLRSVLEQTSWKSGRSSAEKRWSTLRPATRRSMRRLVLTLNDTPFSGSPDCSGFLMTRVTDHEARFDLLRCAHQSSHNEVRLVADELCAFHAHWLKGFAYGLNPAVHVEATREHGRCRNHWVLGDHAVASASPEALSP